MMKNSPAFIMLAVLVGLCYPSCKHEPIDGLDTTPIDTTGMPIDTTPVTAVPCSPDSVYFQNEVLPLLVSNCTESGCHNTIDRQEGIILDSYANLMATVDDVTSTDWSKNELILNLFKEYKRGFDGRKEKISQSTLLCKYNKLYEDLAINSENETDNEVDENA